MKKNPSQLRAIAHLSGPMMVLAGPGSGKTSVIVERTAHMIQEGKIPASSVLVVTFFQGSSSGNERTVSEIYRCSANRRYFRDFSRSVFTGSSKQAYGLNGGNILSEEEKYAILRELVVKLCCRTVPGRGFCGRYCQGDQCCKGWKDRSGALLFFLLPG